ncbi:hypothetical protein [Vibrio renipiscarius]|uniref:Uncharacterized protein n=1 Tax=Vibrio renipiscarius TaxID=1461322 RepID=A0A0C2JH71_9VIBR|nr:hypothetical protein [Vibrio renipiscarius]KII77324.1 hypothetical protein PL18_15500 [Vibrio renipiscarius]KII78375.1 hypothetical protein OJ16_10135 [Vibrio renipiscarius]
MQTKNKLTLSAQACLDWLKKDLEYNLDKNIWGSLTPLYERSIERSGELNDFFEDVHNQLDDDQKRLILEILVDANFFWHPNQAAKIRTDYQKFVESNQDIFDAARRLALLLEERMELNEGSRWYSYVDTDLADILNSSSQHHSRFNLYLRESFQPLLSFDSRYWPTTLDFVEELRNRFFDAEIETSELPLHLLINQKRSSDLDTLILFFSDLQTRKMGIDGLPKSFKLRDSSVASAINIGLDLPPEGLFTAEKVKVGRQNLRKKGWDVWGERYECEQP